ncbi:unnamed protein product, partial [Discosporangium mesarthrocarpum]
ERLSRVVRALLLEESVCGEEVEEAEQVCATSHAAGAAVILELCSRATSPKPTAPSCPEQPKGGEYRGPSVEPPAPDTTATTTATETTANTTAAEVASPAASAMGHPSGVGGFAPILLQASSFSALGRILRAVLDQAQGDGAFLQARNCLVAAGLFAVLKVPYITWLRNRGASGGADLAVMADSELVHASDATASTVSGSMPALAAVTTAAAAVATAASGK